MVPELHDRRARAALEPAAQIHKGASARAAPCASRVRPVLGSRLLLTSCPFLFCCSPQLLSFTILLTSSPPRLLSHLQGTDWLQATFNVEPPDASKLGYKPATPDSWANKPDSWATSSPSKHVRDSKSSPRGRPLQL